MSCITRLYCTNSRTIKLCTLSDAYIEMHAPAYVPKFSEVGIIGNDFQTYDIGEHRWNLTNGNYIILTMSQIGNYSINLYLSDGTSVYGQSAPRRGDSGHRYMGWGIYIDDDNKKCGMITVVDLSDDDPLLSELGHYYGHVSLTGYERTYNLMHEFLEGSSTENTDPYDPPSEVPSDPGGSGPQIIDPDPIEIPELPSISAVDSGMVRLYSPTISQVKAVAHYLWTDFLDVSTNIWKMISKLDDVILGLSILPFNVPISGTEEIKVANISTHVSSNVVASQYYEHNCGSLNVSRYYNSFLDYSPYTKIEIYLPFIGLRALNVDEVMNKTLNVVYHIDILTGACVAFIKSGNSVLYQFSGQCGTMIPVNSNDFSSAITQAITIAGAIGATIATSGAAAPAASASLGGAAAPSIISGSAVAGASVTAANSVASSKPTINKSGSMSGSSGLLGIQYPYLIYTIPRQCLPANQNKFIGYPSFKTVKLSSLSGMTIVNEIHLENVNATDIEKNELESILKGGVIL